jgi:ectoine hydroxylase
LEYVVSLTEEQEHLFRENGYIVVENALDSETLDSLNSATDAIYDKASSEGRLEPNGKLNLRNCLVSHDAFLPLVDHAKTVPLAWQLLNWNIQLITSHLIVLPSGDEPTKEENRKAGYHRDGGTSPKEMAEPHPMILLKIAYALSDQSDPACGATRLVPGSNRMTGRPPTDSETGHPRGAVSMNVKAGSAFIFEQRTWHSIGKNWSGLPRKTLFMGYGYRWVKPMDYVVMPDRLIEQCNPVQKQLLGVVSAPISYYIPRDEDVPIKALMSKEA